MRACIWQDFILFDLTFSKVDTHKGRCNMGVINITNLYTGTHTMEEEMRYEESVFRDISQMTRSHFLLPEQLQAPQFGQDQSRAVIGPHAQ